MANERSTEMRLPSLSDLFSSQEERDDAKLKRIYEIPLDVIDPFPDHPFKVRDDEDMQNLVESVKANGVLTPATVRKKEDGRYELLSGHRRLRACQIAGIPTLRCEVVEMSRDEATIFMVESNFHRSKILPSEKAMAYRLQMETMKHQGKKGTSAPDAVGKKYGDNARKVQRYIRLTYLHKDLLDLIDNGKMIFRRGLCLPSDLNMTADQQDTIIEIVRSLYNA